MAHHAPVIPRNDNDNNMFIVSYYIIYCTWILLYKLIFYTRACGVYGVSRGVADDVVSVVISPAI